MNVYKHVRLTSHSRLMQVNDALPTTCRAKQVL